MKKILLSLLVALIGPTTAFAAASATVDRARLMNTLQAAGITSHDIKFIDANIRNQTPEYTIVFNEGAAKGWNLLKADGTAFSGTALALNYGYAGPYRLAVSLGITGTIIPATETNGLDITADASAANNDAVELWGGIVGASGKPFIVGTDPAFKFCVTTKIHDVSGTDGYYIGFRALGISAAAITSYTDFAAIGNVSGNIVTITDLANAGEVSTTLVSSGWADDASKEICTKVSATGATTYTINGSTDSDAVAYTFADGLQVVPFAYLIQDSDIADDTWISTWQVAYQ